MHPRDNLEVLRITRTNRQTLRGCSLFDVVFRVGAAEPQKIAVPWWRIACLGAFRDLLWRKCNRLVHHESQTAGRRGGRTWSDVLCETINVELSEIEA
jgi:hypothetical protein